MLHAERRHTKKCNELQQKRARNWSQEVLAERSKTTLKFISLIERGLNAPSFETLEVLAVCLGVDVKEMFEFSMQDDTPRRVRRSLLPKSRRRGIGDKQGRSEK